MFVEMLPARKYRVHGRLRDADTSEGKCAQLSRENATRETDLQIWLRLSSHLVSFNSKFVAIWGWCMGLVAAKGP